MDSARSIEHAAKYWEPDKEWDERRLTREELGAIYPLLPEELSHFTWPFFKAAFGPELRGYVRWKYPDMHLESLIFAIDMELLHIYTKVKKLLYTDDGKLAEQKPFPKGMSWVFQALRNGPKLRLWLKDYVFTNMCLDRRPNEPGSITDMDVVDFFIANYAKHRFVDGATPHPVPNDDNSAKSRATLQRELEGAYSAVLGTGSELRRQLEREHLNKVRRIDAKRDDGTLTSTQASKLRLGASLKTMSAPFKGTNPALLSRQVPQMLERHIRAGTVTQLTGFMRFMANRPRPVELAPIADGGGLGDAAAAVRVRAEEPREGELALEDYRDVKDALGAAEKSSPPRRRPAPEEDHGGPSGTTAGPSSQPS